ncbi:DUF2637 domain-containing protein [Marinactinospora thermotolerans]|uniref:DUF2637 domain-containing protein n=1 Tax=Marinactinospora thermotolerans TaxID=531310 RepID=UPI001F1BBAFF|nr:DUF2637 domain-containing protein [Marinactinospora thermotolerans]
MAAVAVVVSCRHAHAVVTRYGETGMAAWMIPLTVDGLVHASSMVILDAARNRSKAPVPAWVLPWADRSGARGVREEPAGHRDPGDGDPARDMPPTATG